MADFTTTMAGAYVVDGLAVVLGRGVHSGAMVPEAIVNLPLAMMNRDGLVAGATGTGKTMTLHGIAEQLSAASVPVSFADVKGDLSGLAAGVTGGLAVERAAEFGVSFTPTAYPVEFLSQGGIGPGVPVRATVSEFGPRLPARITGDNETRERTSDWWFATPTRGRSKRRCPRIPPRSSTTWPSF